jgi:hypothetical protein
MPRRFDRPAVPRRKRCQPICAVSPHLIAKQRGEHELDHGGTGGATLQNEGRESHCGLLDLKWLKFEYLQTE